LTIYTDEIRAYSKLILSTMAADGEYGEYIFLSFSDSYIYLTSRDSFFGRIRLHFKNDEDAPIEDIYINTLAFITLCLEYEELSVEVTDSDHRYTFFVDEERFEIPMLRGSIDKSNYDYETYEAITFTPDTLAKIKSASHFTGTYDESLNMDSVYLSGDQVVATDRFQLYAGTTEVQSREYILASSAIPFLSLQEDNFVMFFGPSQIFFNFNEGEAEFGVPNMEDNGVISLVNSNEYKQTLDIKSSFIVEKQELLDILKFFEGLVRKEVNQQLFMVINSTDSISVIAASEEVKGNRDLNWCEAVDDLIDYKLSFGRATMVQALKSIHDDFIEIWTDTDPQSRVFICTGKTDTTIKIATAKFV